MRTGAADMDPNFDLALGFEREHGRFPTIVELMLLREAEASVALDKGDVQTLNTEQAE